MCVCLCVSVCVLLVDLFQDDFMFLFSPDVLLLDLFQDDLRCSFTHFLLKSLILFSDPVK
jgi:hypothetical protein